MRKSVSGENREFLSADQRCQSVDGGDSRVDIVTGIFTAHRIERQSVYIPFQRGDDRAQIIDGLPDSVKCAAQHIRRERDLHGMSGEFCVGVFQGHVFGTLKHLNHGMVFVDFYDTADFPLSAVHNEFHDLIVESVLHAFQSDQRSVNTA